MRAAFVALCLISTACGGLRTTPDGGSGGGTSSAGGGTSGTGGSSGTGGGTSGTGGGSGGTGGGTAATGGGTGGTGGSGGSGGAGGGTGMLRFAGLAVQTTTGDYIVGIGGRSGEVYAVSDVSQLFRSTGGTFTEIPNTGFMGTGKGVYVAPDGAVFPVSQRQLGSCLTNCTAGTSYTFQPTATSFDVEAVCGRSSSDVYAIIEDVSFNAQLYKWSGTMWMNIVNNLGVKYPRACVVLSDGTVAVAGERAVAFHLNGVTTVETAGSVPPLTTAEAQTQQWYGIGLAGSKLWVSGYARRVSVRNGVDTWETTLGGGSFATAWAIGGTSEKEVLFGGSAASGITVRRFDGTMWRDVPALPTITSVRSMFVAGPNEIYFGGTDGTNPAIDKAFR